MTARRFNAQKAHIRLKSEVVLACLLVVPESRSLSLCWSLISEAPYEESKQCDKQVTSTGLCYGEFGAGHVRKPVDFDRFSEATRQLGLYWLVLDQTPSTE